MKNLLVSLSGFGAFILGVVLSFDFTGVVGRGLIRENQKSGAGVKTTAPENDLHNLRGDWEQIGGDFRVALKKAHEQS